MQASSNVYPLRTTSTPTFEPLAPEPLAPKGADLSGFDEIHLPIERIKSSREWAIAKRRPELAFFWINMAFAAFRGVSAGSLENDDMVLADAAMASDEQWGRIRPDVLEGMGWVLCTDNRWHHPLLADIVKGAWGSRLEHRRRTEKAREARAANRAASDEVSVTSSVTENVTGSVTERIEEKGEERNRREKIETNESRAARAAFDLFWKAYPNKVGKPAAEKAFRAQRKKLNGDTTPVMTGLERYEANKPADRQWLNPATFLSQQRYLDEPTIFVPGSRSGKPRRHEFSI